ncbi:MAG: tol-pal system protein YbgF [Deltaproteobacteria bacterium]|nr:tol-pal system protein YbgF [Deltaproteobacteria bacterium]
MHNLKWLIIAGLISLPLTVQAKSADEKIAELEKKIQSLQETYLQNNKDVASAVAKAETVLQDAQALKGAIDVGQHELRTYSTQMDRRFLDLEHRLNALEEQMRILIVQTGKALKQLNPKLANETDAYQAALNQAKEGNYLNAVAKFETFLKAYPKSEFVGSARYWIGECFFGLRDFPRSIKEFQKYIEKHPRGDRIKNALLRQGLAFAELGKSDEAKLFLEKVIKEYPNNDEATEAQGKLDRLNQKPAAPPPVSSVPESSYPEKTLQEERQEQPPPEQMEY